MMFDRAELPVCPLRSVQYFVQQQLECLWGQQPEVPNTNNDQY